MDPAGEASAGCHPGRFVVNAESTGVQGIKQIAFVFAPIAEAIGEQLVKGLIAPVGGTQFQPEMGR